MHIRPGGMLTPPAIPLTEFSYGAGVREAVLVVSMITVATTMLVMVVVVMHRAAPVIKASTFEFNIIILIGITLLSGHAPLYAEIPGEGTAVVVTGDMLIEFGSTVSPMVKIGDIAVLLPRTNVPTTTASSPAISSDSSVGLDTANMGRSGVCVARYWLTPLSILLIIAPIFVKTARIVMIFNTARLQSVSLPLFLLVAGVSALVGIQVLFLTVTHGVGDMSTSSFYFVEGDERLGGTYSWQCSESTWFFDASIAYIGLLCGWGSYLAWVSRSVPSKFNETQQLFSIIAFISLYAALILPVQFSLSSKLQTLAVFRCCGLILGSWIILGVLYIPKLSNLLLHDTESDAAFRDKKAQYAKQMMGQAVAAARPGSSQDSSRQQHTRVDSGSGLSSVQMENVRGDMRRSSIGTSTGSAATATTTATTATAMTTAKTTGTGTETHHLSVSSLSPRTAAAVVAAAAAAEAGTGANANSAIGGAGVGGEREGERAALPPLLSMPRLSFASSSMTPSLAAAVVFDDADVAAASASASDAVVVAAASVLRHRQPASFDLHASCAQCGHNNCAPNIPRNTLLQLLVMTEQQLQDDHQNQNQVMIAPSIKVTATAVNDAAAAAAAAMATSAVTTASAPSTSPLSSSSSSSGNGSGANDLNQSLSTSPHAQAQSQAQTLSHPRKKSTVRLHV